MMILAASRFHVKFNIDFMVFRIKSFDQGQDGSG